ncbi:MAG: endo alpha-1,4 polygalactosaminidase [Deltaproteobacteria bacterium]|nr:endo alpha-1,4 polygalactosaminidase [Deltaproteobacteria bacterium]
MPFRWILLFVATVITLSPLSCGCGDDDDDDDDAGAGFPYLEDGRYPFGYLLAGDEESIGRLADFNVAVFDAVEDGDDALMEVLAGAGTLVLSYVNLGSLENWRSFYDDFSELCLATYENWEDECWIDVRDEDWRNHFVDDVCASAWDLGADGFYIDNVDIYSLYPDADFRDALVAALQSLRDAFPDAYIVVQNGGDLLLDDAAGADVRALVDATSREDVSFIPDFDAPDGGDDSYLAVDDEERGATLAELDELAEDLDVFTVDYTNDAGQMLEAVDVSRAHGFTPFVGDTNLSRFQFYPKL